jgi:hypothetical protein
MVAGLGKPVGRDAPREIFFAGVSTSYSANNFLLERPIEKQQSALERANRVLSNALCPASQA